MADIRLLALHFADFLVDVVVFVFSQIKLGLRLQLHFLHLQQVVLVLALDVIEFKFGVHVDLCYDLHVLLYYLSDFTFLLVNTAVNNFDLLPMVLSLLGHFDRVRFPQIVQGFLSILAFEVLGRLELLEFSSVFKHLLAVVVSLLLNLGLVFVHD